MVAEATDSSNQAAHVRLLLLLTLAAHTHLLHWPNHRCTPTRPSSTCSPPLLQATTSNTSSRRSQSPYLLFLCSHTQQAAMSSSLSCAANNRSSVASFLQGSQHPQLTQLLPSQPRPASPCTRRRCQSRLWRLPRSAPPRPCLLPRLVPLVGLLLGRLLDLGLALLRPLVRLGAHLAGRLYGLLGLLLGLALLAAPVATCSAARY